MSLSTDIQYLYRVSHMLPRFRKTGTASFNFRCPYCGDSQKSKTKARGHLFPGSNALIYKCFNCEHSTSFSRLLKMLDPEEYKAYALENFSCTAERIENEKRTQEPEERDPPVSGIFSEAMTMRQVYERDRHNVGVRYLVSRKMPGFVLDRLYFTSDFQAFTNRFKTDKPISESFKEPRIVIPLVTKQGVEFGFQGRSILEKTSTGKNIRYLTVIVDDRYTKAFGMDFIDESKPIWAVEGAMDSFFLPNCFASLDSSIHGATKKLRLNPENVIHVFDNEPRNKQVVGQVQSAVNQGYKVAFWPSKYEGHSKDLNGLAQEGFKPIDVYRDLSNNVKSGLSAQMELMKWQRV